jgi:mycofactocin precursor
MTAEVDQQVIDDETPAPATDDLVEDVLVEEVSIDGMCGVY